MMISRPRFLGFMVVLALTCTLVLTPGFTRAAQAASEDVAMFYDDLSQYGEWADYDKYGPVWRPTQVPEDWRPYTDGRWTPTDNGYVFETQEPWGWATYHYGNWMPTEGNGWVWVPGRTWYPSTVEWRTSPEDTPVDESYIGWAPTPPPDYVPPPSLAPPSYYQGSPVVDALTAPLWIFARAASFLLGFGQPFAPTYSYINSGILMPPAYVPVFFSRTVFVPAYVSPAYYPAVYGGRRVGFAAYSWGPPVGYVSRVTRINPTIINRTIYNNSMHFNRIHSAMAPPAVLQRHGYLRQIMPPALAQGRRLPPPHPVQNVRMAQANLNKPNVLPPLKNVPRLNAQIPRVQAVALPPGRGLPGTALPPRATMPLTPQMTQQIQKLPPQQRFVPASGRPFTPAATQPGPGQPAQIQPGRGRVRPAGQTPGRIPAGEFHRGAARPGAAPGTPATAGATKPGAVPLPPGYRGLTPEQRRQQELEHQRLQRGGAPGQFQSQQQRQPQSEAERLRRQQLQRDQQQRQPQQQRERQLQQQRQREQRMRDQQMRQQQQQRQREQQMQQQQLQRRQQQEREGQLRQQRQRQPEARQQQMQRHQQPEGVRRQQIQPQPQERQQPQRREQRRREEER
jgi:hypothetical protein